MHHLTGLDVSPDKAHLIGLVGPLGRTEELGT
jgi:hypothetical protein